MSSLWYEYLEESGGEVIPSKYFNHVNRSFETVEVLGDYKNELPNCVQYARNYDGMYWWPIKVVESLGKQWLRVEYVGVKENAEHVWWNCLVGESRIQSIDWCVNQGVTWKAPQEHIDVDISDIIKGAEKITSPTRSYLRMCSYERIRVGGYLECWLDRSVGLVWPVKVLSNIGGRVRLSWFGCESTARHSVSTTFVLFYLDHRLRGLGWARSHGWRYCAPDNSGISIAINNPETFVRGSPGALVKELCCENEPEEHSFEEGWLMEAVDPLQPATVRPAIIANVFNRQYFLVELQGKNNEDPVRFAGFAGMAYLMPANLSDVSGFSMHGLFDGGWHSHLMQVHTERYAPHSSYFSAVDDEYESAFLPGCKLEAVNPWRKDQIHAATVTRCMEGNRLIWVRLDSEPDLPDFLVDPRTSVDLFPVGWCEMMNHPLILPILDPSPLSPAPFDTCDITIYLHPQCFLGPFLSRSAATQILPMFIGPGHCLPVFRELFHLLLKVSNKPHKLKRLLQLDNSEERHDLMATITIPSPKSEYSSRNRRPDWLVEVAVRKRAIPEFCRQTALSLGACPWFITTQQQYLCSLGCGARLSAKAGEKMTLQKRKRLFARPLASAGVSYRTLKTRIVGGNANSSSNSEGDSSEGEAVIPQSGPGEHKVQTRGVRLPLCEPRRRNRRKPAPASEKAARPPGQTEASPARNEGGHEERVLGARARGASVGSPVEELGGFAIDPVFLAGEIGRVTLTSNPLHWTAEQVADYLSGTDCRQLASWLAQEKVDGPAFLLLTLPVLSTLCGLQLEAAVRLCKHVVSIKRAFVEQFVDCQLLLPSDM